MFAEKVSNMAEQPYSYEVNKIVQEAIGIFESECTQIANRGGHSINTTAKYYDGDYNKGTVFFGNYDENYYITGIPQNVRASVFSRIQDQLREEIRKAGFINFKVEGITEGPIYDPIYLFGRRTFMKDKSNPKFKIYIKITVSW